MFSGAVGDHGRDALLADPGKVRDRRTSKYQVMREYRGTVKRSVLLERLNGMVTRTQAANRQHEAASWWPSRYGQDDEADALNEISPGKILGSRARRG